MASGYLVAGLATAAAVAVLAVITRCLAHNRKKTIRAMSAHKKEDLDDDPGLVEGMAQEFNSNRASVSSIPDDVMEALADPNTHLIEVYGSDDEINRTVLQTVRRRVQRDELFDMILTVTLTKKSDVTKIQGEIARQLGFNFTSKSMDKRAREMRYRIKNVQKILIILCDLHKGLDLGKVGIPFGADHTGCKIRLTSESDEVLSTQMHTQRNFVV